MVSPARWAGWALWVGLIGCQSAPVPEATDSGQGAPVCTELTWVLDADGDGYGEESYTLTSCTPLAGYVAVAGDCDDSDPTTSPAAEEACDGKDNDCDGEIDEAGQTTDRVYWNLDGDGYGADRWEEGCDAPAWTSTRTGDCDDTDARITPSADEVCDGIDNNCDGEIDEDTAVDVVAWFHDRDSDGVGGTFNSFACGVPGHNVTVGGDCDDNDASAYPDAPEICDGRDNDCDTKVDEFAVDAPTWYRDADGDGAGNPDPAWTRAACEAPAGYVGTADDCDDTSADVGPLAPEICGDGLDNNCDGLTDDCAL